MENGMMSVVPGGEVTVIAFLFLVVVGVVLGFKKKIVVFSDYNDLFFTFCILLAPMCFFLGSQYIGFDRKLAVYISAGLGAVFFLVVTVTTIKSNQNIMSAALALITKVPLGLLFVINLVDFVAPSGSSSKKRTETRRRAMFFLLLLTPIVYGLVDRKEGFFNPFKMPHGRRVL